ncbi:MULTISPECIES: LptA/OstA family protein [Okeania]|uniref:OstA family protein n=1 Tax=Okeania hirsuta TaxID=1458930 RepID=A0A3N6PBI7_9CYAN|nr:MULTISPECIES: LptA/OstA family protein [Okeania]NEP04487.1 OstA family protein [Okeania sp. SIO4D6]NET13949.1 OstA family protein [Okeania sp. SIO1H6]NEP74199.1 OstA family protein [Okeania sp. SIO2G5]NEP95076.1 OstA family protein [Okeania sp. SIO2F5]NEQ92891.1 OstA family protein [Okeania sp. SIO2G4]
MILNKKISKLLILKGLALIIPLAVNAVTYPTSAQINPNPPPNNQNSSGRTMTVRSDIQEADSRTGVVTARGNVQINYPARQIQATAAQAQYFSRERRIVLSGDVFILQEGNTIRGETVTYLIDEGRFIVLPQSQGQVESVYLVPTGEDADGGSNVTAPFNPKPAFKSPISP